MKRLVMLVGSQGSGKSTYCEERLKGYTRISQDDQGKQAHRELYQAALEREEPCIVIDRINHTRHQRNNYLLKARHYGYITRIVWLNTDRETCLKRAKARRNHPTLKPEDAEGAISWYFKSFQVPSKQEADELEIIGPPPSFASVKDICAEVGSRRHIIVGDIHGCFDELQTMLTDLAFNKDEDVLIAAGDLVDRGPKVKEVLEFCHSLPRFYSVMGNHDEKCVRYFEGRPCKVAHGLQDTIDQFGGKMPPDILDWMRNFPLILKTPAGYVVHAGFDPLMTPEEQQKSDCLYMRYYGGKSYFDKQDGIIWYRLWPKEYPKVFYGHIPEVSGPALPNIVSLDGGCVFGDYLKAYDSRDGIVHYVNAAKKYSKSDFAEARSESANEIIANREEYVVGGLLRTDRTDDDALAIYTYTDQCVFERVWDKITRNSRGHIYDVASGECVAYPFPKFFNLNENEETLFENFDWKSPYSIYEKMDGWLGVLYRHEGKFKVASRGSFHSDGAVWATNFIQTKDLSCLPDEVTLVFEIIAPAQKIILDYGGQATLVILAAFDRRNGTEYPRDTVEEWGKLTGLPVVKKYEFTIDDCLKLQKEARDQEGFVIVFGDGRRVKVKTEWYMTLAKIMSSLSPISIWDAMKNGKVQAMYLEKIPEELRPLAEGYQKILEEQYASTKENYIITCKSLIDQFAGNRKQIALNRQSLEGTPYYRAVFAVLDNNEESIDRIVMDDIYPKNNEFKP